MFIYMMFAVVSGCGGAVSDPLARRGSLHSAQQGGHCREVLVRQGSLTQAESSLLDGEAGFQANLLRGGLHAGFFPWQYRIHKEPLVMISESKIGYVYARDGSPLPPTQTLGRIVDCNHFQDAEAFLQADGQRGRQRAILREGVFAINLALFVVITEDRVFAGPIREKEQKKYSDWQEQLEGDSRIRSGHGRIWRAAVSRVAEPAVGGADLTMTPTDTIGIVTVHDGARSNRARSSRPKCARETAITTTFRIRKSSWRSADGAESSCRC